MEFVVLIALLPSVGPRRARVGGARARGGVRRAKQGPGGGQSRRVTWVFEQSPRPSGPLTRNQRAEAFFDNGKRGVGYCTGTGGAAHAQHNSLGLHSKSKRWC